MIQVDRLSKTFHIHRKAPGLWQSVKSLVRREKVAKEAVREISFRVDEGEVVGLVGANGAGKTTLVKMLAGIIHPSSGDAAVLGHRPWRRDNELRRRIALIMGQKQQLWWDLPAADAVDSYSRSAAAWSADGNLNIEFHLVPLESRVDDS